jgi:hypothetical protein
MMPVHHTTRIATPYGNVKMTHTTWTPMHTNYGGEYGPLKHRYKIVFSSDSSITVFKAITITDSSQTIEYKDKDKTRHQIRPNQTEALFRLMTEGEDMKGVPTDSCWLFKVTKGAINGYSNLPEENEGIIAIQNGDTGPIIPLTKENLLPLISSDHLAMRRYEKGKLLATILTYNNNVRKAARKGKS